MAKSKKRFKHKTFKSGTVVVFEPKTFNPAYWNKLSEDERKKYYGVLGYGDSRLHQFVFVCEIKNAPGHCVLISLRDQRIETMRHTDNFREVTEDEI